MGKKSKQKGNSYELTVAKILTNWWQKDFSKEEFNRVPQSGGLRWADQEKVAGDIVVPDDFPFNIECKKRETWNLEQIIKQKGNIFKWWNQSVEDAKRVDRIPVLIFSKNYMLNYIMIQKKTYDLLYENNCSYIYLKELELVVLTLNDFLKAEPYTIKTLDKKLN